MKGCEIAVTPNRKLLMMKRQQQIRLKCVAGISIVLLSAQFILPLFSKSSDVEIATEVPLEVVDISESTNVPLSEPSVVLSETEPEVEDDTVDFISTEPEVEPTAEPEVEEVEVEEHVEEVIAEIPDYSQEDAMCIANMIFGEVAIIIRDDHYTIEEQNHVLQEWACVPLNHVKCGIADTVPNVIKKRLSSGYYVWHPKYATQEYADSAMQKDPEMYQRCMDAAITVLTGQMEDPLPENVIYASLKAHGKIYKTYSIRTKYYSSTVYLSCG